MRLQVRPRAHDTLLSELRPIHLLFVTAVARSKSRLGGTKLIKIAYAKEESCAKPGEVQFEAQVPARGNSANGLSAAARIFAHLEVRSTARY